MSRAKSAGVAQARTREFAFLDEDFEAFRALARSVLGINLNEAKRELVYGRLVRRLRALGLRDFADYRCYLKEDDGTEIGEFCNAITTNLTSFFRENHHFEFLGDHARTLARGPGPRRLRIWSAGCSTGEEAYSIAMTLCDAIRDWRRWDIRILATDIDTRVLEHGAAGIYPAERVEALEARWRETYFEAVDEGWFRVRPEIRKLIVFKQFNLMHPLPMRGPLDAVFCRNVIIYFEKQTQRELFERIAPLQQPGGLLFLGHSESLLKVSDAYVLLGKTVYRRS